MPTYEYTCIGCGRRSQISSSFDAKPSRIECPECKSDATYSPSFSCSVGPTYKMWSGRKQVNFKTDNRQEIAKKQISAYIDSGRFDRYCANSKVDKRRRKHLYRALETIQRKAPPVKVDL